MGHAQGQGSWASSLLVRDGPLPATAGLSGSQGFWSGVVAVAFTKRDSSPGVVGPSLQESDRRGPPLPCPPQSPGPTCRRGRCLCRWRWAPRRAVSSPPVPCWACCAGGGRGARGEWGGGLSPGAGRHPPQRLLGPLPRPSPPQEDREESILPREDGAQPAVSTFPCTRLLDGVAGSAGPPCGPPTAGCLGLPPRQGRQPLPALLLPPLPPGLCHTAPGQPPLPAPQPTRPLPARLLQPLLLPDNLWPSSGRSLPSLLPPSLCHHARSGRPPAPLTLTPCHRPPPSPSRGGPIRPALLPVPLSSGWAEACVSAARR